MTHFTDALERMADMAHRLVPEGYTIRLNIAHDCTWVTLEHENDAEPLTVDIEDATHAQEVEAALRMAFYDNSRPRDV